MKLVIGSAQLGMNYGLFNNKKINCKEFKKIEKLIIKSKINFIDTAVSYGNSENIIGSSALDIPLGCSNILSNLAIPSENIVL